MKQKARVKREAPRRGRPLRNVSNAFRAAEQGNDGGGAPSPSAPPAHPAPAARGVAEQAVATAYRVLEEYMQRGREAARRHHPRDETGGPMRNDHRQDPASMAMHYWANMAQMWFGYMAPFMPGMAGQGSGFGGAFGADDRRHRHAGEEKLELAVEVHAEKPVEVTVKLHDKHATRHLEARHLQPRNGGGPPLTGIHFDHVDHHLRVQVTVAPGFPEGVYEGMIHDRESGAIRGTLQVAIGQVAIGHSHA